MSVTYLSRLQEALHHAFEQDSSVFLLGEDLLDPYGGAFKVSQGLSTRYPTRVLSTPISESAIVGVGTGMALRGLKPVVEIMFGDFLFLCADQLVNHAAKFSAMYGGAVNVPMVIRTPMGGGRGYGPTHSQLLEKFFLGVPGLNVVAPSHLHDPGEILLYSIFHAQNPILFIEHKLLYPLPLFIGDDVLSVQIEQEKEGFPTAILKNFKEGVPDATLLTYGGISRFLVPLLSKLYQEEIRIVAVLPSLLKPVPIDTLVSLGMQSGLVLVVEEGTAGFNWGSEVSALVYERLWGRLKKPIARLASKESVIPAGKALEEDVLVNEEKIESALLELLS
jgi:pyruvate/2-oxoglutarate/acetoin dehydrogenase E1 component